MYLDSGVTSLKPKPVIDAVNDYYSNISASIHRGVYEASQIATEKYESARSKIATFINAATEKEVVFTSGTTESLNLLAQSFGTSFIGEGDEVLISHMEHHANIVPWQMLCEKLGCELVVAPIDDRGEIVLEDLEKLVSSRTKLISVTMVSNSLGTVNPIKDIISLAKKSDIPVCIDAAQAVVYQRCDVQDLGCDFFVFSGHKLFGPTGIGVLWGKKSWLDRMPPVKGGGDMIRSVSFDKTIYAPVPEKFEGGTPNIAGAIGLGAAIDYISQFDFREIEAHEADLLEYCQNLLKSIPGIRIIGEARKKVPIVSFVSDLVHPHDMGTILDQEGIAVRAGHHCTQPVMKRYSVAATTRASMSIFNTRKDIDLLVSAVKKAQELFQ